MKALILAGGRGTRLWPLSRAQFPKQFLKIGGEESFLQQTVARIKRGVAEEDIFIITTEHFYQEVARQVPELEKNILIEPEQKNTGPAIVYALQQMNVGDKECLFISPADHVMAPLDAFVSHLTKAQLLAEKGALVTFGVRPQRPETGYGYIRARGEEVIEFVEKPDLETAQRYLLSGDYFWNSGMFVFEVGVFFDECRAHCPELLGDSPPISIDYALFEKSKRVKMVPLDLSWSDVGAWDNVYDLLEKDGSNNATLGQVEAYRTTNSLLLADKRMIATIGLDGVIVVETDDVVLVAPKEEAQSVKQIVSRLKDQGRREIDEHLTIHRPWGSYTILGEEERFKIKRIYVKPLHKLSLQLHYHRSEHWVVVSGTAKVTIGSDETIVHEGESIFVPKSSVHRVENPGKVPLEIIEIQVGEYLGEDDIVRLEDVYGRLKEESAFKVLLSNTPSR